MSYFKIIKTSVFNYYDRHQRWAPVIAFVAGFGWDSLTLTRIDRWSDNIILFIYLILLASAIVIQNLLDGECLRQSFIVKHQKWLPLVIQFFIGGLFSSYVVFYFQSAALSKNWLFLALLVLILIGNEFIEHRLSNRFIQFILLFLAAFSFFTFFIPILIKAMNAFTFILSGLLSICLVLALLYSLGKKINIWHQRSTRFLAISLIFIYLLLNGFYFLNWIPPVPLALKDSGIYHHASLQNGRYKLQFEKGKWYQCFKDSDNVYHYQKGDTVFCFASVFAPTDLQKNIVHQWQYYHPQKSRWITTDQLDYSISGGREEGYRGYTYKRHLQEGRWRVKIRTGDALLLGYISFKLKKHSGKIVRLKTIYR